MEKSKKEKKLYELNKDLEKNTFLILYIHFIYKFFGRKLFLNKRFKIFFYKNIYNSKYEAILMKANLKILPEEYFLSIYLSILFLIFSFIILAIIFIFINTLVSVLLFYGGIVFVSFLGIFMYNYPIIIAKRRGDEINASMPYLLPYMKILAKEINLSKIIQIIDDFLIYKEIKIEFRKIKYYSEFLGYDIHSSIRQAMQSCPSRELSDLMNDLVTISNSGGDIYSYLDRKLNNLNSEIEAIEKKNIDTLLIFSQIYVVILLIGPLFFTIMSTILNLIEFSSQNGATNGADNTVMIIVILLFVLPFAYTGFMFLIYFTKPLYSRLKPLKNGNY